MFVPYILNVFAALLTVQCRDFVPRVLSFITLSKDCISMHSNSSYMFSAFIRARNELGLQGSLEKKKVESMLKKFSIPGWGIKLFSVQKHPIAYAIAFKCDSEGIAGSLFQQDDYLKNRPSEWTFFSRRSTDATNLNETAVQLFHSNEKIKTFTFLREPLSHFISGLVESHFRAVMYPNVHFTPSNITSQEMQSIIRHNQVTPAKVAGILNAILTFNTNLIKKSLRQPEHYSIQSGIISFWKVDFVGFLKRFNEDLC